MPYDRAASIYYDVGEKYVKAPSGRDLRIPTTDPVDYATKLNEIDSRNERLLIFLNSVFNPTCLNTTLEASFVRTFIFAGVFAGATYGGIAHTQLVRERYIRKHNAAAFESQHLAQRKYYDYVVSRVASRAGTYALKGGLLTGGAGIITCGSIVYRDKIYPPDWYVGFATMGALSRFSLGPKAWLFGAGMGLVVATLGLASAYGIEWLTGMNTTQMRYINHKAWLYTRLFNYEKIRMQQELDAQQKFRDMENLDPSLEIFRS